MNRLLLQTGNFRSDGSSMTVDDQTNTVSLVTWSSNSEVWKRIQKNMQFPVAMTSNGTDGAAGAFTQC